MHSPPLPPPVSGNIVKESGGVTASASATDTSKRRASESQPGGQVDPKRVRSANTRQLSADTAEPTGAKMSAARSTAGSAATVLNPTSSAFPAFDAHKGARRLVIKLLNTEPRNAELEKYYEERRQELGAALQAIFACRKPQLPLERLYRGVEDLCSHGGFEKIYDMLKEACESYMRKDVVPKIKSETTNQDDIGVLRCVYGHWKLWNDQLKTIRSTFSYLDRSFLVASDKLKQVNDLGISIFKKIVFTGAFSTEIINGICELIAYDRNQDVRFDGPLLHKSINMLHITNVYSRVFEAAMLKTSTQFLKDFASEKSALPLQQYVAVCKQLLTAEEYRCDVYNMDSTTKGLLLKDAHDILIRSSADKLLDTVSVGKLLHDNAVGSAKALYELLYLTNMKDDLQEPWATHIRRTGSDIVNDTTRGDEMVVRLLKFRRDLSIMVRDAFDSDPLFERRMREAFSGFINDRKVLTAWKTDTSKVGEMIAKYIDDLLKHGVRNLPHDLRSDLVDRTTAEHQGISSTGDEDAELDRQLDMALDLFRFIDGKDVFEAFYKNDLARRLLTGKSNSADAEKSMISKLRNECGSSFTHKLESMFRDMDISRDLMKSYEDIHSDARQGLDLKVNVLNHAAWPDYGVQPRVNLPSEVVKQLQSFEQYYLAQHKNRKLTWMHRLSRCTIKAHFNRVKELEVSGYQALVLILFNETEKTFGVLSYQQISDATGLSGPELDRTLQSLACGKVRVLKKAPRGRSVDKNDTFEVDKNFTHNKTHIKINQIQAKETKEENAAVHAKVAEDRQLETQAAIVRVMKARKTMTHTNLIAEVFEQTKKRGVMEASEIKKSIEKLIDKDYLERSDDNQYTYIS